jgi:hypothetical protein
VKLESGTDRGVTVCAAVTDSPIGILQNAPESGQAALVAIGGTSKVSSDEALAVGDYVGSSADGQAQVVVIGTETTVYAMGQCVQASGAAGELATVTVAPTGRAA